MKPTPVIMLACLLASMGHQVLWAIPQAVEDNTSQAQRAFYQAEHVQSVHLQISPENKAKYKKQLIEQA